MAPEEYLRGVGYAAAGGVPYPRADPADHDLLPPDTWAMAQVPAGVHLVVSGDAPRVTITCRTTTADLGYRGQAAGTTIATWRGDVHVDEAPVTLGEHEITVAGPGGGTARIYLPEGMRPEVLDIVGVGGSIEPAPRGPRWICYGDSITEGWGASGPATSWAATVAREVDADVLNMGYAGSARGEAVSARHVASRRGDLVTLAFGTNCWSQTPHSADELSGVARSFIDTVRAADPDVPILVVSPVVRPDAETTPNAKGATLADLRASVEDAARGADVTLLEGGDLITSDQLADGIHPNDDGHRVLADHIGAWASGVLAPHQAGNGVADRRRTVGPAG